ncbi:MAG: DEAD/DEAH box helicase family protein [Gammaproteobacteria bacterium]|nr:DEAD/DEAH box helicase family protein [Gammaproteobacteria bacterium]
MHDEAEARRKIDNLLTSAGWHVCDMEDANVHTKRGVAVREFPLETGHGYADYLLYIDGKAAGVIEAKKEGVTLTGVETQSDKYTKGLPAGLPHWGNPLPFSYQSTGIETRFTNGLDPSPRSRRVFAFHTPEHLAELLTNATTSPVIPEARQRYPESRETEGENSPYQAAADSNLAYTNSPQTFLARMQHMPSLEEGGLWPAQITAINNLEQSLRENRPRALIQMATGSGKTYTAINFIYRLIKFAGARRILFLVDRGNLADQTLKEFQQYVSPYNNFKFSEEYIVQRLSSNTLDKTARVCICTIQRLFSMLKGRELSVEDEDQSVAGLEQLFKKPEPIEYNPNIPIETFDIIITDECHRSIYNLWAQVLEYFDAYLIGLTATPSKQTFGFFNQNLVMEFNHEMAVADGVNVNYDVYRIRTQITEAGSRVEAGYSVQIQERDTRKKRWEKLDDDFEYDPDKLDKDVVTPDQIRTIIKAFREKLFTEIYPNREWVPKTLIFAKDDNHAENIVEIVREEFGKGNDFAQKITYRTTGVDPKTLIKQFRTSPMPRIAVTVDMIATGTDIKPVEIVMFMRAVKSRAFFEQMKGRGVRVIKKDDLKAVTPDAISKDHFVIIDAVGVCEMDKTDSHPMEQKPTVSFEKLTQAVQFGNTEPEVLISLAGRLSRMNTKLEREDEEKIAKASGGLTLRDLSRNIVDTVNSEDPPEIKQQKLREALKPFYDGKFNQLLSEIKRKNEITIDVISQDHIIDVGFSQQAKDRAKGIIESFEKFIEDNKDEITALQILYNCPYKQRLNFEAVKELADAIEKPPHLWTESQLWHAYAALEKSKVKGAGGKRILTDLVSLVRFAIHQDNELIPFPERVNANFNAWLATQQNIPSPLRGEGEGGGEKQTPFTEEQLHWLHMIRDHIAANLSIEPEDFELPPFTQEGGLGKVHQLFGDKLNTIIEELNETLAA